MVPLDTVHFSLGAALAICLTGSTVHVVCQYANSAGNRRAASVLAKLETNQAEKSPLYNAGAVHVAGGMFASG